MTNVGSVNRVFRVVWNAATGAWQAVTEIARGRGKSSKSGAAARPALVAGAFVLMGAAAFADALPTGATVVAGTASISQSGSAMTINQSSARLATDWQSFSIGAGNSVTFNQPSASSVALNRVLGPDVSVIQGALKANGQVFLQNPNGVLFTPTAQVDVGGLVASTLKLGTADFMAGNYRFSGSSSNAIVNQGNITAANGGSIALIAARIINSGNLSAPAGNVLLGAGSLVTLDLGGPVKLQVQEGALETLIANGGAIRADGGQVLLTSKAAGELAASVINNTGVIEAEALATGEKGEVVLFAHGGQMNLGGSILASGGSVETSGKNFSIASGSVVKAANWLIDPVNITIDATLAGTIASALGAGDVTISTAGGNTPSTTAAESGSDGNIQVNADITWSTAKTLTLTADNNITVNANITASNSGGGVIFLYGQAAADGGSSAYSAAASATVTANSQQWRKGSDPAGARYAIVNGDVFLGNKYIEVGINAALGGKFGTSTKPSLFFGRQTGLQGIGLTGDADGFGTGTNLAIDYFLPGAPVEMFDAGYKIAGVATNGENFASLANNRTIELLPLGPGNLLSAKVTATLAGNLKVEQVISLAATGKFLKNDITLTNVGASVLEHASFARSFDPDNTKDLGGDFATIQLVDSTIAAGDAATVVSATSKPADAYASLSGGSQAKILYYTTDSRAQVAFTSGNVFTLAGAAKAKGDTVTTDGNMGMVFDAGTLAVGATATMSYYNSLDNRSISAILSDLNAAAGPVVAPAAAPVVPSLRQNVAIQMQQGVANDAVYLHPAMPAILPNALAAAPGSASGGLVFVPVAAAPGAENGQRPAGATLAQAGMEPSGYMRVLVLGDGLQLPEAARR